MCAPSPDDSTKCVFTGYPLQRTQLGDFCSGKCGLLEAIILNNMKSKGITSVNSNSPAKPLGVAAANRYIDHVHKWISSIAERFQGDENDQVDLN